MNMIQIKSQYDKNFDEWSTSLESEPSIMNCSYGMSELISTLNSIIYQIDKILNAKVYNQYDIIQKLLSDSFNIVNSTITDDLITYTLSAK